MTVAYCKIGSTDISAYVSKITAKGNDLKTQNIRIPGYDRSYSYHDGRDPRAWELDLLKMNNEQSLEDVVKLFNLVSEDTAFYPRTNAKFARIYKAAAWEGDIIQKLNEFWRAKALVISNSPYLFGAASTQTPALGSFSSGITPAGSVAAPMDAFTVTGTYSGGSQLTTLKEEIWDNAGAVLLDSLVLSNRLLSNEVLTLDYKGKIVQTYSDDFADGTRWGQDAVNDGCSQGAGKITVGNEKSFYYLLKGPWPLRKNLVVSADIVISAGVPVLQYGFDGTTWTTAYSGTDLTNSRTWVIPNTRGRGDVYIRFKSQSTDFATLTTALTGNNNDLKFTARKSGTDGNNVTITLQNAGGTQTLLITVSGNDINVRLKTTSGTINSTAFDILSQMWSQLDVMGFLSNIEYASGNDGTGVVTALAKTNLAGATVVASMMIDNLSITQEREIPNSEFALFPLGSTSKVKFTGAAGGATISFDYRDRYWI